MRPARLPAAVRGLVPSLVALALLISAAPASAAGLILDDFEWAGFDFGVPPDFDFICQGSIPTNHAAAGRRCINLDAAAGGSIDAESFMGDPDDAVLVFMTNPGDFGTAEFWWEPSGVGTMNLRQGGADRIVSRFLQTPDGGNLTMILRDENGFQGAETLVGTPGSAFDWEIDFAGSNFSHLDLGNIRRVTLYCSGSDDAIFELADVRTVRASAIWAVIDTAWPEFVYPVPSPPCDWEILDPLGPGVLHRVELSFDSVISQGSGFVTPARLMAASSGPAAEAQCFWEDPGTPFDAPRYVLRVAFQGETAFSFIPLDLSGMLQPGEYSFSAEIPVSHIRGGRVTDHSLQRIVVSRADGQELRFDNVTLERPAFRGGGPEAYLLSFTVDLEGSWEPDAPLFEVHLEQDWADGELPTDAPVLPALVEGPGLAAHPSVTRSGTVLHLARPADHPTSLFMTDVTGRQVRRLDVPVGASRVEWDGRGSDGRPTASGVYFVRRADGPAGESARIVRIR